MANRYATKSGNWSDVTVWDGGVSLPGIGDVVRPNGFTVTIDQDIAVSGLSNNASTPAVVGGSFSIVNVQNTQMTISIDTVLRSYKGTLLNISHPSGRVVITNGADGALDSGTAISISGGGETVINGGLVGGTRSTAVTVNSSTLTINGNVQAVGSSAFMTPGHGVIISGSSEVTIVGNLYAGYLGYGVWITGGSLTVTGNVSGGSSGTSNHGMYINGPSTVLINGNITGGSSYVAINCDSAANLTVNGNVTGYNAAGIQNSSMSAIFDINGAVAATSSSHGISSSSISNRFTGPLIDAPNGRKAIYAPGWLLKYGTQIQETIMDDNFYAPGSQVVLSNYVSDSPPPSDVRAGKVYGTGSALIGTLEMPTAEQTMTGIPVDDTVGTAALSIVDIAAVTGAQIAKAVGNG